MQSQSLRSHKNDFLQLFTKIYFGFLIACLPLYIIRFKFYGIPTTFIEILLLGFLLLLFVYAIIRLRTFQQFSLRKIYKANTRNIVFYASCVFILFYAIFSVFLAIDTKAALGIYKAYIVEPILVAFMLLYVSKEISFVKPFLIGSGMLIIWLFLLCVLQTFANTMVFAPDEASLNRATGVFTTPNALGLLIGPVAGIFASYSLTQKRYVYRALSCFVLACAASTIVLSQSLTSLLAFSFATGTLLVIYLFFAQKKWHRPLQALTSLFVAALFVGSIVFFSTQLPKLAQKKIGSNLPSDSLTIRFYLWQGAFSMVKDNFYGVGFSSFPKAYAPYRVYKEDNERKGFADIPLYPHNMLLNFWSELGLIGAIFFFWFCFYAIVVVVPHRNHPFALGLIAAFVYTLIHGITDVPYFKNDLALMFWVLVAFAVLFGTRATADN